MQPPAMRPAEVNRPELLHHAQHAVTLAAEMLAAAVAAERAAGDNPTLASMCRLAACDAQQLGRRWDGIIARLQKAAT